MTKYTDTDIERPTCPDGGFCHHDCADSCWRVSACTPLTASGWEDWPARVKAANPPVARLENVLLAGLPAAPVAPRAADRTAHEEPGDGDDHNRDQQEPEPVDRKAARPEQQGQHQEQ